ncbi:MAG TPA: [protein-PII] uridylyltransferase [Planctomycetota bacterium]|nr:[protein-PII] uridylyltransferase [Planctomycetota bacterium]
MLTSQVQTIKTDVAQVRAAALARHRRGDDPFEVVAGFSDGIDGILRKLFEEFTREVRDQVALLAVGGYGRRELCPQSDIDLLFLSENGRAAGAAIEKMVRLLWDGGFQLGHAVRTPEECFEFMKDDLSTANGMLESRWLAGSQRLHERFISRAVNRYRARRSNAFISAKIELLRESIEDPNRTIHVIEPNLKEGACGLRDIQRVLWIEKMKREGDPFESLLGQGRFSAAEVHCLRDAYGFYLRVRSELHFTNGVRQDILERDSMVTIATLLGYGQGLDERSRVEALMGNYYRHARNVYRFLRFYLQTDTRGRSLLERVSRWWSSRQVRPHLSLYRESLYLTAQPSEGVTAESIIDIFAVAQEKGARLSEDLCDWIRREVAAIDGDLAHMPGLLRRFRAILRGPHVGRVLKTLHATGVLDRILPEFGKLDCLVNLDGHHQFTVDEHTLKTLEELDRIQEDPAYPEPEFRKICSEIKDQLPLRLALLLHDIGKAIPGKHSVSGAEAATLICERLGLDERVVETVDFLVYRHLELFRVSELRDFTEDGVVEALARLVEKEDRLKMLYLLTYIDIVSVGPGTWTRWKGAQLSELYNRTLIHIRTGTSPGENLEIVLSTSGLSVEEKLKVLEHCRKVGTIGYTREILPERMHSHVMLVERFLERGETQVAFETFVGYHDVTFCGGDRPGLFADLAGILFSEGLSVLGARIFSRSDGVVIDLFQVEVADTIQVSVEERIARIRRKLRRVEAGQESVEDFIRQRTRSYRVKRWGKPLFGPSVTVDNNSSGGATVIEVSAGDRPGLLYDLARALHTLGLDVRTAKVSTLTDRAHDVFYVVDRDGRKVDNPARRSEIAQVLSAEAQNPAALPG